MTKQYKKIKSKILNKFPTLEKIKELEKQLKDEQVTKLDYYDKADISYKGTKYIDIYSCDRIESRAEDRVKSVKEKVSKEKSTEIYVLQELNRVNDETITDFSEVVNKLNDDKDEQDKKLHETQKELEEAFVREKDLRKDLIEVMKLNNALNSRTIETKIVASEPIEIKPIKKSKVK